MDYVFICVPCQQLIIISLYLFLQIIGSGLCVYLCTLSTVDNNIIFVFTDNW